MFKMLLVGYLYGIKSERRLEEEVRLNLAYRWFCGFKLDETIPDHSTFSKTRTRKWQQSDLFQKVFQEIVKRCITSGLELLGITGYTPAIQFSNPPEKYGFAYDLERDTFIFAKACELLS